MTVYLAHHEALAVVQIWAAGVLSASAVLWRLQLRRLSRPRRRSHSQEN